MIGKGIQDYIQIRAAIIGFRAVVPVSLLYLATCFYKKKILLSEWLAGYAVLESAFYFLVYLPRNRSMQKVRTPTYYPDFPWAYASTGGFTPTSFDISRASASLQEV